MILRKVGSIKRNCDCISSKKFQGKKAIYWWVACKKNNLKKINLHDVVKNKQLQLYEIFFMQDLFKGLWTKGLSPGSSRSNSTIGQKRWFPATLLSNHWFLKLERVKKSVLNDFDDKNHPEKHPVFEESLKKGNWFSLEKGCLVLKSLNLDSWNLNAMFKFRVKAFSSVIIDSILQVQSQHQNSLSFVLTEEK